MCGIGGWFAADASAELAPKQLARFAAALAHRGPDDRGWEQWPHAGLVHTRLSILDLSAAGHQPLANEDRSVWTVFNGEIYNHRSLRRDLAKRGHQFRGHSDTEVLPHLYEQWGNDFAPRLRGMFALAIYDARRQRLILARDRFGIKPLFYTADDRSLTFASELGALRALSNEGWAADPQSVSDFASLMYVPAPSTFYKGVYALCPGEMLIADLHGSRIEVRRRNFHEFTIAPDPSLSFDHAVVEAEELIDTAVSNQLESDVLLGSMLSGGIDSSIVSAVAQRRLSNLQTFNVRFPDRALDETPAALEVAAKIGSSHRTLEIASSGGRWDHVVDVLQHAGQPFADSSLLAVDSLAELVRGHVTVALAGDGGDEGFGGYAVFRWLDAISLVSHLPRRIARAAWLMGGQAATTLGQARAMSLRSGERARDLAEADDAAGYIEAALAWVRPREHRRLCAPLGDVAPVKRLFEPQWHYALQPNASRREHLAAQTTEVLVRLWLANDFLFKVDNGSMRHALEIRVPMLDEDLFDFALKLPQRLRVRRRITKPVLRAIARNQVSDRIASLPKRGFVIPMSRWVDSEFRANTWDLLSSPDSQVAGLFDRSTYLPVVEAFCRQRQLAEHSQGGIQQRVVMLIACELALGSSTPSGHGAGPRGGSTGVAATET